MFKNFRLFLRNRKKIFTRPVLEYMIQYNTIQFQRFVKRRSTICPEALTELCKRLSKQECL